MSKRVSSPSTPLDKKCGFCDAVFFPCARGSLHNRRWGLWVLDNLGGIARSQKRQQAEGRSPHALHKGWFGELGFFVTSRRRLAMKDFVCRRRFARTKQEHNSQFIKREGACDNTDEKLAKSWRNYWKSWRPWYNENETPQELQKQRLTERHVGRSTFFFPGRGLTKRRRSIMSFWSKPLPTRW